MSVISYELDQAVFKLLNAKADSFDDWQNKASGISEYVASWGVERFWAMSRSPVLLGGKVSNNPEDEKNERSYFAWGVARVVLCQIVGTHLNIKADMTTEQFQERFRNLNLNQQVLLTDLLIEISDTIQFWTMRIKDAKDSKLMV